MRPMAYWFPRCFGLRTRPRQPHMRCSHGSSMPSRCWRSFLSIDREPVSFTLSVCHFPRAARSCACSDWTGSADLAIKIHGQVTELAQPDLPLTEERMWRVAEAICSLELYCQTLVERRRQCRFPAARSLGFAGHRGANHRRRRPKAQGASIRQCAIGRRLSSATHGERTRCGRGR